MRRLLLLVGLLAVVGCRKPTVDAPAPAARPAPVDFSARLHRQAGPAGNTVSSPLGVSTALSMLRLGARGDTDHELAELLGQTGDGVHAETAKWMADWNTLGDGTTFKVANSLWGNAFLPAFAERAGKDYRATVKPVDWSRPDVVAKQVNDWVSGETAGRIPAVVTPADLSDQTIALLVNATYFDGKWAAPFNKRLTRPAPFTLADGAVVNVPTMGRNEPEPTGFTPFADGVAVAVPFRDGRFVMVLALPNKPDGLSAIEEKLTSEQLAAWASAKQEPIDLQSPTFRFSTRRVLNDDLKQMGAPLIFEPAADFSGLAAGPAFVGQVIHEARIEVGEAGATAAAGTVIEVKKSDASDRPPPRAVRIDRPFVFAIIDTKTMAVAFLGRVVDPRRK